MAVFCRENSQRSSKRCNFLSSVLNRPFADCHTCCRRRRFSYSSSDEDETHVNDFEHMQEMIESMIRSRAMESKVRRKRSLTETYTSILHPFSGELFLGALMHEDTKEKEAEEEEEDEFASVKSYLSRCSFDENEAYYSLKTDLSCCSSLKDRELAENKWWSSEDLDSREVRRRKIIQEICNCKGWPFGLCRKTLLLPPLPKSPSESWLWCRPLSLRHASLI